MNQSPAPRVNKLPFLFTDLLFVGVALAIIYRSQHPIGGAVVFGVVACVALGAWACLTPFLRDHDTDVKFAESDRLIDTVSQIQQLKLVGSTIQAASAQWQTFQENSSTATASMKQLADQLSGEARAFAESMQKANDAEKSHLRLEVEKLKRSETDWVKLNVTLLDHVFALYQAGVKSGQQRVIQQLTGFQLACRDVVRRVGLVPFEPRPGDAFNPKVHQLHGEPRDLPAEAQVGDVLAPGYSFQGQMIRPALVSLGGEPAAVEAGEENSVSENSGSNVPADPQDEESPVV